MRTLVASIGNNAKNKGEEFNYRVTDYKFIDHDDLFETPFIFEAIVKHHLQIEEEIQQVILVGTVHSCWQDLYGYCLKRKEMQGLGAMTEEDIAYYEKIGNMAAVSGRKSPDNEIEEFQDVLLPLAESIERILFEKKTEVHILITQYGTDEKGIFYNYKKICDIEKYLMDEEEEKIYLDITHSFRSMPLYHFLLINYLMRISDKKVDVSAIYYGMFELKGEEQLSYAPIVDMKYLMTTMNWINGLNEFNSYGSVYEINRSFETKTDITNWLEIFEWASNTNNYNLLLRSLDQIKNADLSGDTYTSMEKDVLKRIVKLLKEQFSVENGKWKVAYIQLQLSEWFFDQRRYGLAIITIQECLKTYMTYLLLYQKNQTENLEKKLSDEGTRNNAISLLGKIAQKNREAEKLYNYYKDGKELRNTMAHGLRSTSTRDKGGVKLLQCISKERETLKQYIVQVRKTIESGYLEKLLTNSSFNSQSDTVPHFDYLVFIGKEKCWDWTPILRSYGLGQERIKKIIPEGYEIDYQSTGSITKECELIFQEFDRIMEKIGKSKVLVIVGNTNIEKQYRIIQWIREKNIEVKTLAENKNSPGRVQIKDKNISFLFSE